MSDSGGYPGGYGSPETWPPQGPEYLPPGYQQPGTGQPYPPGYPPYGAQVDPRVRNNALTALIVGCVATVACIGPLAIATVVLGGVALSKADNEPDSARRLTKWAWISLGIAAGVDLLLIVGYILLMVLLAGSVAFTAVD